MKIQQSKGTVAAAAVLFLLIFTLPAFAQQPTFSRDALISAAREIMTTARYCALITRDSAGRTNARAMDPFAPETDLTVWFGTNSRSRKVREIRRNPRVTLYYFNRENQEYVVLTGIARLVSDPTEKVKRWKDEWKAFYPNRATDYLLIKVRPERLEIISEKKKIFGDSRSWKPPAVTLSTRTPAH